MTRGEASWTEGEHRRAGYRLLERIGFEYYALSDRRIRAVAPGIGDTYLLHPRIGGVWWEAKTIRGVLSAEQAHFRDLCVAAGVPHILGTYEDLGRWLYDRGLLAALPIAGRLP